MIKLDKKNKKKYWIVLVIVFLVAFLVASYALFNYFKSSTGENTLKTGTLILELDEESALTLIDSIPLSDQDAMSGPSYNFSIKNAGTETAKYQVYLLDDDAKYQSDNCSNKKLPWSVIRYSIQREDENSLVEQLDERDGIIYTTTLKKGMTDHYKLRLWLDNKATNEIAGLHFHAKLQVKAILEDKTDFDTGA